MKHYGYGIVRRCASFKKDLRSRRPRNGRYTKQIAARMRLGHKAARQCAKRELEKELAQTISEDSIDPTNPCGDSRINSST